MSSYWADALSHVVAFDELTMFMNNNSQQEKQDMKGPLVHLPSAIGGWKNASVSSEAFEDCIQFRAQMLHLFSLLHAVCIQYLLHRDGRGTRLEILGGVSEKEARDLERSSDQAYLVSHRINQIISRRLMLEKGLPIGGPVLSRSVTDLRN